MKALLILSDGIADVPCPQLGGRTPLEAGTNPHLDRLAAEGITGLMDPLKPGIPAGSDTAHIAIFGENPFSVYRGRGYLEALGVGLSPGADDIGFRVNFGTVTDGVITDRRAGRDPTGLSELVRDITREVSLSVPFSLKEATGTRAALVLKGSGLSYHLTDGDPHSEGLAPLSVCPSDGSDDASRTAEIVNDFVAQAAEVLRGHPVNDLREARGLLPANYLLVRGAGIRPVVTPLPERYGISACCIAATALIRGVATCFGLDLIDVPGLTGEYNTVLEDRAGYVLEALDAYDFVFVHFKATDTASHDGNPLRKVEMIEKLDTFVGRLLAGIDPQKVVVALTGDHTTPCMLGDHSGEPVPLVLWGGRVRTDDVLSYGERSCAKGGIGRLTAQDLMPVLMNQAGRVHKFGE